MKQLKEIKLGEGDFIVLKSHEGNTFKDNVFVRDVDYPGCWQIMSVENLYSSHSDDNKTMLRINVDSIFSAHDAIHKIATLFAGQKGFWSAVSLSEGIQAYVKFEVDSNGELLEDAIKGAYALFSFEQNGLEILQILKPYNACNTPIGTLTTEQISQLNKSVIGY